MANHTDTVKVFKRRDSATALLKKMGVKREDYNDYIEKTEDGQVICQVAAAMSSINLQRSIKEGKKSAKAKPKKEPRVTISSLCRSMILDGASNSEIMDALREKYGEHRFGPEKRHYPAWYRCELRRKGELPPAFDVERMDVNAIHKFED